MLTIDKAIQILVDLEEEFKAIALMARDRQATVVEERKSDSGERLADVVTAVDREIQTLVLAQLAKTSLVDCQLRAEEMTDGIEQFSRESSLLLSIDPIDGTANYVDQSPHYRFLINLALNGMPRFTFCFYPATGLTLRLVDMERVQEGEFLPIRVPNGDGAIVVYSTSRSAQRLPLVRSLLNERGLTAVKAADVLPSVGPSGLFLGGAAQGFWNGYPSAFDGYFLWHYALTMGWEIHVYDGDGQWRSVLDLRDTVLVGDTLYLNHSLLVLRP